MATTIDNTYTYPGLLPLRPIEVQPVVNEAPLLQIIPIITGVPLSGIHLNKVLRPGKMIIADDGCSETYGAPGLTWTDVKITPKPMKIQIEECFDVYNESLYELFLRQGQEKSNLIGTEVWSQIQALTVKQIAKDLASLITFGKEIDADGNWNVIDGIVTKILSDSYCSDSVDTISGTMSAQEAVDLLTLLYDNAPLELQAQPASEKVIMVTPNIFRRYRQYLQQTGNTYAQNFQQPYSMLQNGATETLDFNGITVAKFDQWEEDLRNPANPYYGTYNAMAIYTHVPNHRIATDTTASFGGVQTWYDQNSDTNRLRWRGSVGYNFIHCQLNAYAFGNIS